ncbi:MAG: PEP-CTERM sorting domain-containing protein [Akkermansiaceae bacterium]|nr:PEP-CTERM sorting domain-containing protein [Akkermansiaceae bacterium]
MKTTNNKPLLTLACLVATATALPAAIISTTVFVDDFDTDTSADYILTDTFLTGGSFNVSEGTLNVTSASNNTADVFYDTAIFEIGQTVSVDLSGAKNSYLSVSTTTRAANTGTEDGVRLNWETNGTFQAKNYTNGTASTLGFDGAFDVDASSVTLYLYRASDNVFAAAFDDGSGFTWLNTTGGTEREDFTVGDTGNGALYVGVETYNPGTRNFDNLTLSVPEPSSTALLGLGGLALMLRRKR